MKKFVLAVIFTISSLSFAFAATLNNGHIIIEVNGDGDVGRVEYAPVPGSNHVSLCGINLNYDASLHDMDYIQNTETVYNNFPQRKLFTGYGRDDSSNFYVYSVSYIEGSNTNLDQTLVLTMRSSTQLRATYTVDNRIMQTQTNDHGSFNIANQSLMFNEDPVYLGIAARLNGAKTTSHIFSGTDTLLNWLETASSVNTEVQDYSNSAGAVGWNVAPVDGTPLVIRTKLMVAPSDGEIQSMSDFTGNTPVNVPDQIRIEIKKARFTQKFLKTNKDKMKVKGRLNIADYSTALDNLGNLDVSLYIGDYLAFAPGDGSELKVKEKKRVHKIKDANGVRKLTIKRKKINGIKYLDFNFTASKTDIDSATQLTTDSPVGKNLAIMLPFTLVLTGTNPQDVQKGGQVWIFPNGINMTYKKQNPKKAVGKSL